ncbi:MAG: hypothetical protein R3344_13305, partial [Acidobacteriota bacterium]|nr:hypothetical protein [Acidobacteriota bacterium]
MISRPDLMVPVAVAILTCSCAGDGSSEIAAQAPSDALREFEEVCRELAAGSDEYYGTAQVAVLEDELQ